MEPKRIMTRWQKRARALFNTSAVDDELDQEMQFHLEMETAKYVKEGYDPDEARRRARLAFGAVARHRGETRDARWFSWFPDMSLDFRLGGRMLVKYPGITLIGGLAMAFAIWVGVVTFQMVTLLLYPSLPFADGDRVVKLGNWDTQANHADVRQLHEFVTWRTSLHSVTDLGAYRDVIVNLVVHAGDARPVHVAEMTASGFVIPGEKPLLGRTLIADDERAGAPPVVVLGYDVWRNQFNSAKDVVGRSVQIGDAFATIVGVMPQGFEFPVSHDMWMPLRVETFDQSPRLGPAINMFGRLAPGSTIETAQAELTTLGQRAALEFPNTHRNLKPLVSLYTSQSLQGNGETFALMMTIPGFAVMLIVLVCSNVALLMFARAATRESELLVRTALGASRRRIIAQLFAEALVLGGLAAAVGLAFAEFALRQWGMVFLEANMGRLPFWIDTRISATTVLYAIALTLLSALIAGVVPALKVTRGMATRLRQVAAGAGGLKFGGVWTGVIITQVAFTAAFPAMVYIEQRELRKINTFEPGFAAEQYLSVMVTPPDADINDSAAWQARGKRYIASLAELQRQVASEPGVAGVTFVDRLPRTDHRERLIELDGPMANVQAARADTSKAQPEDPEVNTATVDPGYFDVLQAPIIAGRGFQNSDVTPSAHTIVVDQGFVNEVMHGANPLGRRVRFVGWPGWGRDSLYYKEPWYEIVGVVKQLGMKSPLQRGNPSGVYIPTIPGAQGPTNIVVHVKGDPMSLMPAIRRLATRVDPTLQLSEFKRVDQVSTEILWVIGMWLRVTLLLTAVALTLSLAGIYAAMSFTVSRRTREIGIRVALGGTARSVVTSIFKRPVIQVAVGVAVGAVMAAVLATVTGKCQDGVCTAGAFVTPKGVMMLAAYSVVIFAVCLLACVVPTRRALAVEPVEALRSE